MVGRVLLTTLPDRHYFIRVVVAVEHTTEELREREDLVLVVLVGR